MAETPPIGNGSDDKSDVLIDFESEMFRSITSPSTKKIIPVAGRTRNVTTRQGKIFRATEPVISRPGRPKKKLGTEILYNLQMIIPIGRHSSFSSGFPSERSSLHIDTIEALECLKSQFRAGIFTQDDLSLALRKQPEEL